MIPIKWAYYFENQSLRRNLKRGEFEMYINDYASIGEMYIESILLHELSEGVRKATNREISIFTHTFPKDVYTTNIKEKLISFAKEGSLNILATCDQDKVEGVEGLVEYFTFVSPSDLNPLLKTTCFMNNESFALETPGSHQKTDGAHKATFYVNAAGVGKYGDKMNTYKEAIQSHLS